MIIRRPFTDKLNKILRKDDRVYHLQVAYHTSNVKVTEATILSFNRDSMRVQIQKDGEDKPIWVEPHNLLLNCPDREIYEEDEYGNVI